MMLLFRSSGAGRFAERLHRRGWSMAVSSFSKSETPSDRKHRSPQASITRRAGAASGLNIKGKQVAVIQTSLGGLVNPGRIHHNLSVPVLYEHAIRNGEGQLGA